ncbi:MAG: Chemotaxis protein CheY [Holosporales bacterium]
MTRIGLVVDDTPTVRRIMKNFLQSFDFEVFDVENGEEAYTFCMRKLPDCIVIDRHMPVMDGLTFIKKFRKDFKGTKTKLILCTYISDEQELQDALASGADALIMKPIQREVMAEKLRLLGL